MDGRINQKVPGHPQNSDLGFHVLMRRCHPATVFTKAHQKSKNRNQGSQDRGRKDHFDTPCPTAIASNKTQLSVHFLRSLLFWSWQRDGDKTGGWPLG